ncbi:hypothetical protein B0H14DRAFT_2634417 [Mycena olivaceomarginata]|nr:hypothetical protein B0H14DRAFT_2634417 [Mycena olivaceomarginata]
MAYLVQNNRVELLSDADAKYGFKIRNTSDIQLFPYLFYFDPEEDTITGVNRPFDSQMYYPAPGTPDKAIHDGEMINLGLGGQRAFEFLLAPGTPPSYGFFRLFMSTRYIDLSFIQQKMRPFDPEFPGLERLPPPEREQLVLMLDAQKPIMLIVTASE